MGEISKLFKEVWQDFKIDGSNGLGILLYFFILLGFFMLALSLSYTGS